MAVSIKVATPVKLRQVIEPTNGPATNVAIATAPKPPTRNLKSMRSSGETLNSAGESLHNTPESSGDMSATSAPKRETLSQRFDILHSLGRGTYGKVKLARDVKTNELVAIKTIRLSRVKNKNDLERINREIQFLSRLNHPHIIKIKEVYQSRDKIIIVMEYAAGGELYDYLKRKREIPEAEARAIFREIVSAVHYLHKNNIVHRDLKLENILMDRKGHVKLCDFGLSNTWSRDRLLHTFCGSPLYASPEIVNGTPYYGPEVDCWSLGVLLYTLVYHTMPFQGGDFQRLTMQISTGSFIEPREISGAYGLIKRCLCVDPSRRATIDDIAEDWWVNVGYKNPPIMPPYYLKHNTRPSLPLDANFKINLTQTVKSTKSAPARPAVNPVRYQYAPYGGYDYYAFNKTFHR